MKIYAKDSEDNIVLINSLKGAIPEGFTEVSEEDLSSAKLSFARKNKEANIRAKRDQLLLNSDKDFLIALSKNESTEDIESDKTLLRDMMETVVSDLAAKKAETTIAAYDPFESLGLSRSYE